MFIVFVFVELFFVSSVQAAISIADFNVNGSLSVTVKLGDRMTYNWKISATKAEVVSSCGQTLSWSVSRDDQVPPDRRVVASGTINADNFLISTTQTGTGTFSFTPLTGKTSESLTLKVGCGREPGANILLRTLTRSSPVTVNFTGQTQGQLSVRLDVDPKKVTPNTNVPFQFDLSLTAKQSDLDCTGGASAPITWGVYMFPAGSPENFSVSTLVQEGAVTVGSFGTNATTLPVSFPKTVRTLDRNFVFKARVICDRTLGSDILTTSSAVPIVSGGAGGDDGGGTCGGTGQPACKPGESKTIGFEIPNPLKGGVTDLGGLVKVLAQWLFNLAIPIAVIMIIYAGVLFLTARGNPTTVTKAKDVLKYAVVGLVIILIGSGFVTLIQSILELGAPSSSSGQPTLPIDGGTQPGTVGAVGNKCDGARDCLTGLKCQDSICKRATGNRIGEPCNAGRNCDVGLSCDKSGSAIQPIDGQTLGSCYEPASISGGRIGDLCEKNSNCISGLKCNKICQRKDGNLNGEACVKVASPSNCKSKACHTIGANMVGDCVPYSGT